ASVVEASTTAALNVSDQMEHGERRRGTENRNFINTVLFSKRLPRFAFPAEGEPGLCWSGRTILRERDRVERPRTLSILNFVAPAAELELPGNHKYPPTPPVSLADFAAP